MLYVMRRDTLVIICSLNHFPRSHSGQDGRGRQQRRRRRRRSRRRQSSLRAVPWRADPERQPLLRLPQSFSADGRLPQLPEHPIRL